MIEVFKTDIINKKQTKQVVNRLQQKFQDYQINFDLEDCDKILRIETPIEGIEYKHIIELVSNLGFSIEILKYTICFDSINSISSEIQCLQSTD